MEILDQIVLSPRETETLLGAGNGDAALLYIYRKATGNPSLTDAEKALRISMDRLQWAEVLLKRLGLEEIPVEPVRYDPERAPTYSSEDVQAFAAGDPAFQLLQGELNRRLGRLLSSEELKTLLSFRDYLKMPPEVVSMALTLCIQKNEYYNRSHGSSRTVSIRALERECYEWANQGIVTLERASAHISTSLERLAPEGQVRAALGLDRALVPGEKEYVDAWLDMGFAVDAIRLAYEKTVLATGRMAWPYMNKILLNWHEKNLHTARQVTEGDRKKSEEPENSAFTPGQQERAAVNSLKNYRDSLKE